MNKQFCSYARYKCTRTPYSGYNTCYEHINPKEDEQKVFLPCTYVSTTNGRRCNKPFRNDQKLSSQDFCEHHTQQHLENTRKRSYESSFNKEGRFDDFFVSHSNSAFTEPLVNDPRSADWNPRIKKYLRMNDIEQDHDLAKSVESNHGKTWCTDKELLEMAIKNAQRLNDLYGQVSEKLVADYDKYEKKFLASEGIQGLENFCDKKVLQKLHALTSHKKCSGQELLIKMKSKGIKNYGHANKSSQVCEKCSALPLPCSKLCRKHIVDTSDSKQQWMYKTCRNPSCDEVVTHFLFAEQFCSVHTFSKPIKDGFVGFVERSNNLKENAEEKKQKRKDVEMTMEKICNAVDRMASNDDYHLSKPNLAKGRIDTSPLLCMDMQGSLQSQQQADNAVEDTEVLMDVDISGEKQSSQLLDNMVQPSSSAVPETVSKFSEFANQRTFLMSSTDKNQILMQPLKECAPNLLVPVAVEETKVCPVSFQQTTSKAESFFGGRALSSTKNKDGTVTSATFQTAILAVVESKKSSDSDEDKPESNVKGNLVVTSGTLIPPYESPPKFDFSDDETTYNAISSASTSSIREGSVIKPNDEEVSLSCNKVCEIADHYRSTPASFKRSTHSSGESESVEGSSTPANLDFKSAKFLKNMMCSGPNLSKECDDEFNSKYTEAKSETVVPNLDSRLSKGETELGCKPFQESDLVLEQVEPTHDSKTSNQLKFEKLVNTTSEPICNLQPETDSKLLLECDVAQDDVGCKAKKPIDEKSNYSDSTYDETSLEDKSHKDDSSNEEALAKECSKLCEELLTKIDNENSAAEHHEHQESLTLPLARLSSTTKKT